MRWLLLLSLYGCRPDYWIPAQAPIGDAAEADSVIAAVREANQQIVAVRAAKLIPCDDQELPAPPVGAKRVHGNLRKSAMWRTGVGLVVAGILGTIVGVPMAVSGALSSFHPGCYNCTTPTWIAVEGMVGAVWATLSEVSFLAVGPALIAVGARDSAGQQPTMPGLQLRF